MLNLQRGNDELSSFHFQLYLSILNSAKSRKGVPVIKLETDLFLEEFEAEAKNHIENIEASFLDTEQFTREPALMNAVFRAAHSLKGTAGFFSLEKIVAVAHELESVFTKIKDGELTVDDEITDIVLQSVDCLKDLVDNIQDDDAIDTTMLIKSLKEFSKTVSARKQVAFDGHVPFDLHDPNTESALRKAVRRGHKVYYVNFSFDRGLGNFYKHPETLLDGILSVGDILGAIVNNDSSAHINEQDRVTLSTRIIHALNEHDTSMLELLVTSVLEFELFSIATEIDKKHIHLLHNKAILDNKGGEKPDDAEKAQEKRIAPDLQKTEIDRAYKKAAATGDGSSIRLDISAINGLVDLANEMILARNRLNSVVTEHRKEIVGIMPILHDVNRLSGEIQERVMYARMQPVSMVFAKFPRIIRDTAKLLDKEIEIEIYGESVTLDKYLLDSLADPITQLVKNSADHGVESSQRRLMLGKPEKGKITLGAQICDGLAIIEVSDDGAGLDTNILSREYAERGVLTEDALKAMSKEEILALIFEPGFSTAKKVTNLSGRGVGMDIVKTNIAKVGGTIEIDSEVDVGTTIRLKMPLTLSVLRTLIVTIDSIRYAVPEINVERVLRVKQSHSSRRIEKLNNSLVLCLDERVIPVLTMDEINAKSKGLDFESSVAKHDEILMRDLSKCIIMKWDDRCFALLIDDAVKSEQMLVKPLPEYLNDCLCFSSVAVLGDGGAIAILSTQGIMRLMGITGAPVASLSEDNSVNSEDGKQYIVFKCSGAEYYALEAGEISRIESCDPAHIQKIGSANYLNIGEKTIRVIRPESLIPVRTRRYTEEKLYVLTLKNASSPIGLLAGKVIDKVEGIFDLSHDHFSGDCIFGTSTFGKKVLIVLNSSAIVGKATGGGD